MDHSPETEHSHPLSHECSGQYARGGGGNDTP